MCQERTSSPSPKGRNLSINARQNPPSGYCALQSSFLPVSNAMPENNGVGVMAKIELKTDSASWALRAAAILGVMYGFGFLLLPDALLQLSGDPGVPTNPGWVRCGISLGPWLASEGWVKEQQPFIAGLAAAFTLSGARAPLWRHKRRIWWRGLVHLDAYYPPRSACCDTLVARHQINATTHSPGCATNLPVLRRKGIEYG